MKLRCADVIVQLADFGLSRVMETNATHISTNTIGTIAYQPEEVSRPPLYPSRRFMPKV